MIEERSIKVDLDTYPDNLSYTVTNIRYWLNEKARAKGIDLTKGIILSLKSNENFVEIQHVRL